LKGWGGKENPLYVGEGPKGGGWVKRVGLRGNFNYCSGKVWVGKGLNFGALKGRNIFWEIGQTLTQRERKGGLNQGRKLFPFLFQQGAWGGFNILIPLKAYLGWPRGWIGGVRRFGRVFGRLLKGN